MGKVYIVANVLEGDLLWRADLRIPGTNHGGFEGAGSGLCGAWVDCSHCKSSWVWSLCARMPGFVVSESFGLD